MLLAVTQGCGFPCLQLDMVIWKSVAAISKNLDVTYLKKDRDVNVLKHFHVIPAERVYARYLSGM